MTINPRVGFYLSIVMVALGLIASGTASLTGLVPDPVAHAVVGWCGFICIIYGGVSTALHGYSSTSTGPLVKPQIPVSPDKIVQALVLAAILGASALMLFPLSASAAPLPPHRAYGVAKHVKHAPIPNKQKLSLNLNQLLSQLQSISLQDLQAAKADADAQQDKVASACYAQIITLVSNQQKALSSQTNLPDVHVVTSFQQARDFALALRPGSALSTSCAPLANEVKMDVLNLVAGVTAGSLTLSSFGL